MTVHSPSLVMCLSFPTIQRSIVAIILRSCISMDTCSLISTFSLQIKLALFKPMGLIMCSMLPFLLLQNHHQIFYLSLLLLFVLLLFCSPLLAAFWDTENSLQILFML